MQKKESILRLFPPKYHFLWGQALACGGELEEIRIRAGRPVFIRLHTEEYLLDKKGAFTGSLHNAFYMEQPVLEEILCQICQDSPYAFEDEIRQGFLTVKGGHRVGIVGQAVLGREGEIRTLKHISGLNIRIAHEKKGAADSVLPLLYERCEFENTLLVSPPGCGKTTLLRDIIRQLSDGNGYGRGMNVGLVDERSEIAGTFMGMAQNDIGMRTDVLDACPKVYGMMMLIRSMSPEVVAIDELGSDREVWALKQAAGCGCRLLATIHGRDREELFEKSFMKEILEDGLFQNLVILDKKNGKPQVRKLYKRGKEICFD